MSKNCDWVKRNNGKRATNSVCVGRDYGAKVYVARAPVGDAIIPGKLHYTHNCAYISYDGQEHAVREYEVLVESAMSVTSWVTRSGGEIHENAVEGGHDASGETLYIGRAKINGAAVAGKIQPSKGGCFAPYAGREHFFKDYEILIEVIPPPNPAPSSSVKSKTYDWVKRRNGQRAPHGVRAGRDSGSIIYVARAPFGEDAVVPGKLHFSHDCAYVSYEGREHAVREYELLVTTNKGMTSWVSRSGGDIHEHAIIGGHDSNGENYYIGRAWIDGAAVSGKILPSQRGCYVPYNGREHFFRDYQILIEVVPRDEEPVQCNIN